MIFKCPAIAEPITDVNKFKVPLKALEMFHLIKLITI